jgi:hypothetical protein
MPDEEFLSSFRKRYALLQQKLAEAQRAQSKTEDWPSGRGLRVRNRAVVST